MLDVMLLPELRDEEQPAGLLVRGGGSAANTAAWLGHLGRDVAFCGCVGDDPAGEMLVAELRHSGVHASVRSVKAETGCVAVEIAPDGDRVMRSARGANQELSARDIRRAATARVRFIHLTGYALLGPPGFALLETAARAARDRDAVLSLDPSSQGVIAAAGRERLVQALHDFGVGLFLPNQAEARALTGIQEPAESAAALNETVPGVVVKSGAGGAHFAISGMLGHVPTTAVATVDATGAGDAFNAGVLAALLDGGSLEDGCRLGNEVAGQCVLRYGGRPPRG